MNTSSFAKWREDEVDGVFVRSTTICMSAHTGGWYGVCIHMWLIWWHSFTKFSHWNDHCWYVLGYMTIAKQAFPNQRFSSSFPIRKSISLNMGSNTIIPWTGYLSVVKWKIESGVFSVGGANVHRPGQEFRMKMVKGAGWKLLLNRKC